MLHCWWPQGCKLWILCIDSVLLQLYWSVLLLYESFWNFKLEILPLKLVWDLDLMLKSTLGNPDVLTSGVTGRGSTLLTSLWCLEDIKKKLAEANLTGLRKPVTQGTLWPPSKLRAKTLKKNTGNRPFKALCLLNHVSYHQYMRWCDNTLPQLWILYFPTDDDILETILKRLSEIKNELPLPDTCNWNYIFSERLSGKLAFS